jgi:acylphosphatase
VGNTPLAGEAQVNERLHCTVRGHVQGVGFRFFVREQAAQLDLVGWVRNLSNGDVEVLAEGELPNLDELIDKLKQGPRGSAVTTLDQEWGVATNEFKDFKITKTP